MSSSDQNASEQAIGTLTEEGIKSQLDTVESLSVDIETDPMKLTQGQVDKVLIKGRGMVIQNDLRTEELTFETGAVDIAMLKLPFGKVELEHPTEAKAKVILKPEDIQKAFNADYVKQKLRGQKIELSGNTLTTDASNVCFTIPEPGRIALSADVMLIEKVETNHVEFSARPELINDGFSVTLKDVKIAQEKNDSPELTKTLIKNTQELLDLRFFELEGMNLQFEKMAVESDRIVIKASAKVTSFD
ncbi:MAG: DUF2993 domain-containing protein [Cyanobacteria bacterium J06621_3]